jgi:hypothetical protein
MKCEFADHEHLSEEEMLALVVGDVAPHSDREKLVVNMFSVMSTECVGWCICMVPLCSFTSVNTEQPCVLLH